MEILTLNEVIKSSPVIVHKGRYAYLQGKETELKDHFLVCQDKDETTIVTEEKNVINTQSRKMLSGSNYLKLKFLYLSSLLVS